MEQINRYGCGNGEGMFDDKEGYWVTHEDYKQLLDKYEKLALTIPVVVKSFYCECKEPLELQHEVGLTIYCEECGKNVKQ
jgi:hypothetical protein